MQVVLSVNGEVSSLTEFPTTVALPAINIPAGEIKQYQPAIFSLDMPDNNIASVEWLVNGNSVGTATNTSSLSFLINESGKVKISAKLTLKECSAVFIPEREIDVTEAPALFISGPSTVCDEATYTIQNFDQLPEGATVQWSANNDNVAIVSGQGTETAVFRNNGKEENLIQANIRINDNLSLPLTRKVWIGGFELKAITGSQTTPDPDASYSVSFSLCNTHFNRDSYLFFESVDKSFFQDPNNWEWFIRDNGVFYINHGGGGIATIVPIKTEFGNFKVRVKNACGWSNYVMGVVSVEDCSLNSFALFPNPATDVVTVQLEEENPENDSYSTQNENKAHSSGVIEIQLWNATSLIRTYKTNQSTYQLPISGLTKGMYFVRVIKDGKTYTKKLLKN